MTQPSSFLGRLWANPIVVMAVVLIVASGIATAIGMPIHRITQIAIYTLYGAGVNLLVGYTGLVPFGASVFFGCASYAVAIAMLRFRYPPEVAEAVAAPEPKGPVERG